MATTTGKVSDQRVVAYSNMIPKTGQFFAELYFVIETDSYGHYFKQAVTKYVSDNETENIKQEFLLELEGTQSLRILCYETPKRSLNERGEDVHSRDQEVNERNAIFKGKASFDLTSSCLSSEYRTKELSILEVRFTSLFVCVKMSLTVDCFSIH